MASHYVLSDDRLHLKKVKASEFAEEGQMVLLVALPGDEKHYLNLGGTGGVKFAPTGVLEIWSDGDEPIRLYGSWIYSESIPFEARAMSGRSRAVVMT